MTQLLICLLTLFFSLNSPAMEGNAVFRRSSLAANTGLAGVTSGEASALARQIYGIEVNGQRAVSSVEAFGSRAGSTFRGRGPLPTSDLDIRITLSDPANFGAVNAEMAEIERYSSPRRDFRFNPLTSFLACLLRRCCKRPSFL